MLNKIFIENFALIDRLEIDLKAGLQVITGETGAGKSIILGALRLLLGQRADLKSVGNPEKKSIVEAEFQVSEAARPFFESFAVDFDTETIIRREILPTGKSRSYINDAPVTLDVLRAIAETLIDIHSQFETGKLFTENFQFGIIDSLSQAQTDFALYRETFTQYSRLGRTLEDLKQKLVQQSNERDYQNFLLQELAEADLENTDWPQLENNLSTQENAGQIIEQLAAVISRLNQEEIGVVPGLNDANNRLQKLSEMNPEMISLHERLYETSVDIKDILAELEARAESIEINPQQLLHLQQKMNIIQRLMMKHQVNDFEELLKIQQDLQAGSQSAEDLEEEIRTAETQLEKLHTELDSKAKKLAKKRKVGAKKLKDEAEQLFSRLGLEKARLTVDLQPTAAFNAYGQEKVGILFQANSGFPLKPIQEAASGGERSRVMLVIKKILAEQNNLPTLILDEIDTGVSGKVAEEMGKVMQEMGKVMQLIIITHLAQVAAKGNNNYKVVKQEVKGRTQSTIISLTDDQKLQEIAQLLSGSEVTPAAVEQAKVLIG